MANESNKETGAGANNPFLLNAAEATDESNLSNLEDTGTEYEHPAAETLDAPFNSLEELAATDTSHIHALRKRADAIVQRTEKYVLKESDDVRALCDTIDSSMQHDETLSGLDLAQVREYVKHLMVTLKAKPEFSGILLDSDVRNVVKFARDAYLAAAEENELKAAVQEAKSRSSGKRGKAKTPTAKAKAAKLAAMSAAFDGLGGFGNGK